MSDLEKQLNKIEIKLIESKLNFDGSLRFTQGIKDTYLKDTEKLLKEAKTEASNQCIKGKEHAFQIILHMDGSTSYANYSRCEYCNEVVIENYTRTKPW